MLNEYKKKRKFEKTPEPAGNKLKKSEEELHFVVQKHQASHLHYDLRLELDGVLKSWAVPKGPSLKPEEKHLAQMVEDHPFDYRDFEGTIPEGNYGAGTVMVWDEGAYLAAGAKDREESEKLLSEGLSRGHISFVLSGKKLCGEFALVRLKRAGEASWLLIKANDDCASHEDVTKRDKSAKTGRTMEEIANDLSSEEFRVTSNQELGKIGKKAPMSKNVSPMMATLVKEPFDDADWLFEIKWDGYRAITQIENGKVRMYSRNNKDFNERFPDIFQAFKDFGHDAVFDGEIVAVDKEGKPSFQLLQEYLMNRNTPVIYYLFDILYLDGYSLENVDLARRREILREVMPKAKNIDFSQDIRGKGKEFFQAAKEEDLEGIMAKNARSVYQPGKRGKDWLKIKNHLEQEVVIGGFTAPRGSRLDFGSLAVGVYEKNKLVYIGNVGTGFDERLLTELRRKFEPLIQKNDPFVNSPKLPNVTWVKPELVCEVKFQEWTAEGSMRQPVFLGLREDKMPKDVHKEVPK